MRKALPKLVIVSLLLAVSAAHADGIVTRGTQLRRRMRALNKRLDGHRDRLKQGLVPVRRTFSARGRIGFGLFGGVLELGVVRDRDVDGVTRWSLLIAGGPTLSAGGFAGVNAGVNHAKGKPGDVRIKRKLFEWRAAAFAGHGPAFEFGVGKENTRLFAGYGFGAGVGAMGQLNLSIPLRNRPSKLVRTLADAENQLWIARSRLSGSWGNRGGRHRLNRAEAALTALENDLDAADQLTAVD